jgi:toxin ParE1/3/4
LRDAVAWYEIGAPAVVPAFLLAVDAVLAQAAHYPESFPLVRPDIRRALLRRFPYGVFYSHEPEALVVVAIVHARRDPALWPAGAAG